MILVILSLTLLVIGIVLITIFKIANSHLWDGDIWDSDWFFTFNIFILIFGIVLTLIFGISAIIQNSSTHINAEWTKYEEVVETLHSDYNYINNITDDTAKSVAAVQYNSRVSEFRIEIINNKRYADNPWISWLVPYVYKDMDENSVDYIR